MRKIWIALSLAAIVGYGCMREKPPAPAPPPSNAYLGSSGPALNGQTPTGAEVVTTPNPSGGQSMANYPPATGAPVSAPSPQRSWHDRFSHWMKVIDGRDIAKNKPADDDQLHEVYAD